MGGGGNRAREQLAAETVALQAFVSEYRVYLDLRSRFAAGDGSSQGPLEQSRTRIWQLVPAARRAIEHSGVRLTITPPPMLGGPVLTDFSSQVFAHENAPYLPGPFSASEVPATSRMVLDRVAAAIGELSDQLEQSSVTANSVGEKGRQQESQGARPRRRAPVFGRLKRLPGPLAVIADTITIALFLALIIGTLHLIGSGGPAGIRSSKQQGSSPNTTSASSRTTGQSTTQSPPPRLNADATCASVRDASAGQSHRAIFVDSPGQLEAGSAIKGKILPDGPFMELLRVAEGDELEFGVKLFDAEYGAVQGVVLAVVPTPSGDGCWRMIARAHSQTEGPGTLTLGQMFVVLASRSRPGLEYVPGSTRLLDVHDKLIAHLPDGVTRHEVSIPYEIPPASVDIYYVNWEMRVR
jgi:hypothetical protein